MKPKSTLRHFLLIAGSICFATSSLHAASGTWISTSGTFNWSNAGSWSGGTIADGSGFTADFTTGFTADSTVTLDTSRSIGHIIKDDTNGAANMLTIGVSGGSILTMATGSGAPTITNSDLGVGARLMIGAQLTGTQGLTKLGGGLVYLTNNNNNWSGTTTISEGLLHLGGTNLNNIGGGSGRNISVAAGAAVGFNTLSNAILNRIVETSGEFTVMTGSTSNALDFTNSITGANLSGAFLGHAATNGGKTEITGVITMANNYRLGAPNGLQNGALGIGQASLLSGSNGLIVGGNRVVIVGTHTFTGDTVIRDGARLGLAGLNTDAVGVRNNSSALQNSVLDLGASTATGQIFLEAATTAGPIVGSTTSANGGTTSATFGGLKGSRNLNSAFLFTAPGNNTSATTAANITGFTLNVGNSVTASYSGAIGGFGAGASGATGGASTLTKTGLGTQVLDGTNTYTGKTLVSQGKLIINGAVASTSVEVNAYLGGRGVMANATLSGSGSINPGNSPGIMAASATDPTGGLDYNFEFTAANTGPTYGNAAASVNDVLRLTNATPFTANLDSANIITLYLNVGSLTQGDVFTGGFYTDNNAAFLTAIGSATFQYFLADGSGLTTYEGNTYTAYSGPLSFGVSTVAQTANFGAGDVTGYVTQFTVVPEPRAALLGGLGLLMLLRRRRK